MKRDLLGLVMCGGESRRMGEDKAVIEVREGVTQLAYVAGLLEKFCKKVAVSTGPSERSERELPEGLVGIADAEAVAGPMAGVIAGLKAAEPWGLLVVAVDMPFLEASHLLQLVNRRDPEKLATAFIAEDGYADPMCAIYETRALGDMERLARVGKTSLRRFLESGEVERIAQERPYWLTSVNDPKALAKARERISG